MSEFRKYDRVRVGMNAGFSRGSIGTVSRVDADKVWVQRDGTSESLHWANNELELIRRPEEAAPAPSPAKHSHYFKPCPFDAIDVYRVLSIFSVTDPCIQHAVKKLLVAGGRGHKDIDKDIQDSIDTLVRWQAMRAEEMA